MPFRDIEIQRSSKDGTLGIGETGIDKSGIWEGNGKGERKVQGAKVGTQNFLFFVQKIKICKILSSFSYHNSANFLGLQVCISQIHKIYFLLIHKSQIQKFLGCARLYSAIQFFVSSPEGIGYRLKFIRIFDLVQI